MRDLQQCDFYVYLHKKKTNGEVFYVGKGRGFRAGTTRNRNKWWKAKVEKHGFYYEFIAKNLTNEMACDLEIRTIRDLRMVGFVLCNISDGGEGGMAGRSLSAETKRKLSIALSGRKQTPERAKQSAMAKVGKRQPRHAIEITRLARSKKVINSDGKIFPSAMEAMRYLREELGIPASQGNISMACRGERREAYGLAWSYDIENTPEKPTGINAKCRSIYCSNGMSFLSVTEAQKWVASWRGSANNQPISEAARECNGKSAYGFTWRYKERLAA